MDWSEVLSRAYGAVVAAHVRQVDVDDRAQETAALAWLRLTRNPQLPIGLAVTYACRDALRGCTILLDGRRPQFARDAYFDRGRFAAMSERRWERRCALALIDCD